MAICQFFLQGRCRFGEKCWNEHPRGGLSAQRYQGGGGRSGGGGGGGGWGTGAKQRHGNDTSGSSRDHGRGFGGSSAFGSSVGGSRNTDFSQNRFSALRNSSNTADEDEEERLLESVVKDMETWESSGQWIFSSYSPMKEKPNVPGFLDISPEELHLEYYNCAANHNVQVYLDHVQRLAKEWRNRQLQLKALNPSTKAALLSGLKNTVTQPAPTFGFGSQQTPSLQLPSFPVNISSGSASKFSFQTNPNPITASPGNAAGFGSSAAASSAPAIAAVSSPSVPHSIGFLGPSAASFSFKSSEGASGFGSSGIGSSSTTPLAGFNAAASFPSQCSSFPPAQPPSIFGQSRTSASPAVTNSSASEKLYTPKSDLSAEELEQFEAPRFTLGKIPLKPPPIELIKLKNLFCFTGNVGLQ
ncbi:nucleoporin NUP42-like isoform 2-T2 [Porphyrio hochstetteri]